jgi:hypothetical protein
MEIAPNAVKLPPQQRFEMNLPIDDYCDDDCDTLDECDHDPDASSIRPADGRHQNIIVDIWCKKCGQSGSVIIDPNDIQWD